MRMIEDEHSIIIASGEHHSKMQRKDLLRRKGGQILLVSVRAFQVTAPILWDPLAVSPRRSIHQFIHVYPIVVVRGVRLRLDDRVSIHVAIMHYAVAGSNSRHILFRKR